MANPGNPGEPGRPVPDFPPPFPPHPPEPGRSRSRRRLAVAAVLVALLAAAAVYQLVFKTPNGTLLVEVSDDAEVLFQKGELQVRTLLLDPVPGAVDLQGLAVPLSHPDHHVRHQRAAQAVQLLGPALVVGTGHHEGAGVVPLHRDRLGEHVLQLAQGSADPHLAAADGHLDPGRDRDDLASDA